MKTSLAEEHPVLFHYTGISGLEGIIKSQTLWATHAAFLNDATEIKAFKEYLPSILQASAEEFVNKSAAQSTANQALIEQRGGIDAVINEIMTGIATGMYNALLGTDEVPAFIEPYVTSFCTTSSEQVAQHGLLSQWRGYGQEGGYAIVFDTARLVSLLMEEGRKWGYDLFGGDVVYSLDTEDKIREELGEDFNIIQNSYAQFLSSNGDSSRLEEIYYPFIRCACRYKHWGFHEEKEVRIVAARPGKKLFEEQQSHALVSKEKPKQHFMRVDMPVPYIALFEGVTQLPQKPLPITRIIVGPHRDKEKRRIAVGSLLSQYGIDIPVSVSEIPYV